MPSFAETERRLQPAARVWLTDRQFLDLLVVTNLIPGPSSTELVSHVGCHRAGLRGLVAAGLAFIARATAMVLAPSMVALSSHATPVTLDRLAVFSLKVGSILFGSCSSVAA